MEQKGWIKHYRRAINDLQTLSDQEYRYYDISCLIADWDSTHRFFGTFDARTKIIQKFLPNWSVGKINMTKNSLIDKGVYKQLQERRLEILNAKLIFGKGRDIEKIVQNTENNIHMREIKIQTIEERFNDLVAEIDAEELSKAMPWEKPSIC